jgi:lysophospholipase L1-like esterase
MSINGKSWFCLVFNSLRNLCDLCASCGAAPTLITAESQRTQRFRREVHLCKPVLIIVTIAIFTMTIAIDVCGQTTTPSQTATPAAAECAELKSRLDRAENRLKDWPAHERYRNENLRLAPPSANEKRVVFMGDSITDSWDNPNNGGFFPGKPYVNRGISGQTTPQMLLRFRRDVIELKPKVVVILAGTNDIAGNTGPTTIEAIADNLTSMAELARLHGIRVVFSSVMPVSDYEVRDGNPIMQTTRRPPEKIKALNAWLKDYAAKNKLTYLDYYSAMVDDKGFLKNELSDDGLHPNPAGYAVMNPLVEAAIASSLKRDK